MNNVRVIDVWLRCVNIHSETKVTVVAPGSSTPIYEGPMWAAPDKVQKGLVDVFNIEKVNTKGTAAEVRFMLAKGVKL